MAEPTADQNKPRVLCVDDDRDIAEVVQAVLVDEGYDVSCLYELAGDALERTVGRLEPDCVLLDGVPGPEYGSWDSAAWLDHRPRPVPVVMFTAHRQDSEEAQEAETDRARAAVFSAVLLKPFHLDQLLEAVATAVGQSQPFDGSAGRGGGANAGPGQRTSGARRLRISTPRSGASALAGRRRVPSPSFRPPHSGRASAMRRTGSGRSTGGRQANSPTWLPPSRLHCRADGRSIFMRSAVGSRRPR